MSFNNPRPDFYDDTFVNSSDITASKKIQTKVLSQRDVVNATEPKEQEDISVVRPWRVSFHIETSKVELVFEVKNRIQIGRSPREQQLFDGIDLSPFNGHELGVSRLHAEISIKNERIIITDKDSANGTLINQQRLIPNTPYLLKHGDKIQLGNLVVHVYFLTYIFDTQ